MDTLDHLQSHHRDFQSFHDLMVDTQAGRFNEEYWDFFSKWIAPALVLNAKVLDMGTGPGGWLAMMKAKYPEVGLCGVELVPIMLETARLTGAEIGAEVIAADLSSEEWSTSIDGTFEVGHCSMVLHELPNPFSLLKNAAKLIRPGGRLFIFDWCRHSLADYLARKEEEPALDEDTFQHFSEHSRFSPDDVTLLAERAGFREIARHHRDLAHVMLAYQRKGG
jgi:SAM-dependent methyltransferase|tara:strand:- start:548 stop:1213 length:666 start_codon:yes stop_codon:yes gene_type:complete